MITGDVHFPTNSCKPKVNSSAWDINWTLRVCAMRNSGPLGKPTLVSSDVSAILDFGSPNKHFSCSLPPFELGVGSLTGGWQYGNLGLG